LARRGSAFSRFNRPISACSSLVIPGTFAAVIATPDLRAYSALCLSQMSGPARSVFTLRGSLYPGWRTVTGRF
jgi:hypothetical protein